MMSKMIISRKLYSAASKQMLSKQSIVVQRCFATSDKFMAKEKVEEDRYIREQEKKFFEAKKAEHAAEMAAHDMEIFQQKIAPAMVEAQEALKKSGDTVSNAGLEALARWKLQL